MWCLKSVITVVERWGLQAQASTGWYSSIILNLNINSAESNTVPLARVVSLHGCVYPLTCAFFFVPICVCLYIQSTYVCVYMYTHIDMHVYKNKCV